MRQLMVFLSLLKYVKYTVHWEGVSDWKGKVTFDVFI